MKAIGIFVSGTILFEQNGKDIDVTANFKKLDPGAYDLLIDGKKIDKIQGCSTLTIRDSNVKDLLGKYVAIGCAMFAAKISAEPFKIDKFGNWELRDQFK